METTAATAPTAPTAAPRKRPRTAVAAMLAVVMALTLVVDAQPAEAQVRGSAQAHCISLEGRVSVYTQTNASHHVVILHRWNGTRWVGVSSGTITPYYGNFITWVWNSPGHYRVDVLGWTPGAGWEKVSPITYYSKFGGHMNPYRTSSSYCTVGRT